MKAAKDCHLDALEEANRNKHIKFLAIEEGDKYSDNDNEIEEEAGEVDNGFFTNDNETEKEYQQPKQSNSVQPEKIKPVTPDAAQTINDSVPEGDNNNAIANKNKQL